ncbi:MAG: zinc-ribbon domain-containing protein [Desulfovibrio sp.]|jgi:predicted Zn finger-like uncharacterized protein|nr:zinc-ribbon domain-containing protein [Desulfovibrio sp.]
MIITCPQCETSFALPDEAYRSGRRARCSQCSFVFRLPAAAERDEALLLVPPPPASPPPASGKSRRLHALSYARGKQGLIRLLVVLLSCLGLGYGSYSLYGFFLPPEPVATPEEQHSLEERQERVRLFDLQDVQQFVVENDTLQQIVAIQGGVVNKFSVPKEFIQLEATLYDGQKRILAQKQQICGISLTLFQLRVLNIKEIENALNNRIAILTNNTDIQPGGRVPFTVVFAGLPPEAFTGPPEGRLTSYAVRVVDAQDSKP